MNAAYPRQFPLAARQALYDVIHARRDVRRDFLPDPIPAEVLHRILDAAHHAGSVGFMQPWNFLVLTDRERRERIHRIFCRENERAAARFTGARAELYRSLKLEGMLEAGANLCVTCDRERHGPEVLGRNTMRDTDLYSTCCAIQNLWLAARAEGLGVGWVSILDPEEVKRELGIPESHALVAYLCLGYVRAFADKPDLERAGWLERVPLSRVTFSETWGTPLEASAVSAPVEPRAQTTGQEMNCEITAGGPVPHD
ncbi:MAG: 5,6-dimethylbenzimidazole synthase [Terriglobales bacterium]